MQYMLPLTMGTFKTDILPTSSVRRSKKPLSTDATGYLLVVYQSMKTRVSWSDWNFDFKFTLESSLASCVKYVAYSYFSTLAPTRIMQGNPRRSKVADGPQLSKIHFTKVL